MKITLDLKYRITVEDLDTGRADVFVVQAGSQTMIPLSAVVAGEQPKADPQYVEIPPPPPLPVGPFQATQEVEPPEPIEDDGLAPGEMIPMQGADIFGAVEEKF